MNMVEIVVEKMWKIIQLEIAEQNLIEVRDKVRVWKKCTHIKIIFFA